MEQNSKANMHAETTAAYEISLEFWHFQLQVKMTQYAFCLIVRHFFLYFFGLFFLTCPSSFGPILVFGVSNLEFFLLLLYFV